MDALNVDRQGEGGTLAVNVLYFTKNIRFVKTFRHAYFHYAMDKNKHDEKYLFLFLPRGSHSLAFKYLCQFLKTLN